MALTTCGNAETKVESADVESVKTNNEGEAVIDTNNDEVTITETEDGDKIATIKTEDGNEVKVAVKTNENGETVIDTTKVVKDYYGCGSTTSCNKRTIIETTYNSWDELSNDLAFYKSEFGLDLSYAKENCYEKTWVVDKAAYDEVVVDHYECSCGATK